CPDLPATTLRAPLTRLGADHSRPRLGEPEAVPGLRHRSALDCGGLERRGAGALRRRRARAGPPAHQRYPAHARSTRNGAAHREFRRMADSSPRAGPPTAEPDRRSPARELAARGARLPGWTNE